MVFRINCNVDMIVTGTSLLDGLNSTTTHRQDHEVFQYSLISLIISKRFSGQNLLFCITFEERLRHSSVSQVIVYQQQPSTGKAVGDSENYLRGKLMVA